MAIQQLPDVKKGWERCYKVFVFVHFLFKTGRLSIEKYI